MNFFGPLSVDYCVYFYAISIFFFVLAVIATVFFILGLLKSGKDRSSMMMIPSILSLYLMYFVNRLLNSMCQASLSA